MKTLTKLITPFEQLSPLENKLLAGILIIILLMAWTLSGSTYTPPLGDILASYPKLLRERELVQQFMHSLFFCFKAIFYSAVISIFFCYISVLPVFSSLCNFMRKFRFLPSAGLSLLFLKIADGYAEGQMMGMMVFGITTWLLDSMVGIALGITQEEKMYARSLRLNKWQQVRELLIKGRAAQLYEATVINFAIAWMLLASVENLAKASGGIGVVLAESNKYFKYEEVYAIQLLILFSGILIDFSGRKIKGIIYAYTI